MTIFQPPKPRKEGTPAQTVSGTYSSFLESTVRIPDSGSRITAQVLDGRGLGAELRLVGSSLVADLTPVYEDCLALGRFWVALRWVRLGVVGLGLVNGRCRLGILWAEGWYVVGLDLVYGRCRLKVEG